MESQLFAAHIPSVMGLRPSHGTWQWVPDPKHPPAFTPAEAAHRLPKRVWQRTVRLDSHGKELVRYVAELELGNVYGPICSIRLVAATLDPAKLDPDTTWYLATSLSMSQATTEPVYELYRLRDRIEHYYEPAKHELGWADYQMRPERAIVRHWHLVMLVFTFSLLMGSPPATQAMPTPAPLNAVEGGGEKDRPLSSPRCPNLTNQRLIAWKRAYSSILGIIKSSSTTRPAGWVRSRSRAGLPSGAAYTR